MSFESRVLQGRVLTVGGEGVRAHVQAGLFQRVVDQAGAIVVRVAGTTRLTVAVGIVRGDVLGPFDP